MLNLFKNITKFIKLTKNNNKEYLGSRYNRIWCWVLVWHTLSVQAIFLQSEYIDMSNGLFTYHNMMNLWVFTVVCFLLPFAIVLHAILTEDNIASVIDLFVKSPQLGLNFYTGNSQEWYALMERNYSVHENRMQMAQLIERRKNAFNIYKLRFWQIRSASTSNGHAVRTYQDGDFKSTKGSAILNIKESHLDSGALTFGQSWHFDFVAPSAAEFRGIVELYHLVMYQLLAVFFILIVLAFYALQQFFKKDDVVDNILAGRSPLYKERSRVFIVIEYIPFLRPFVLKFETFLQNNSFSKFLAGSSGSVFWVYYSALEFVWTLLPCIILLFISLPSFTLALALDEAHKPSVWVKVIGNQWFWVYEYSTYNENITIFSNILQGSDLDEQSLRLLVPDNCVTIVYNKFARFLVTSTDVIHSWAVPSMGIKVDACPGRINAISILPTRAGVYYGQCSEICGINHAFMPICVEVIL